MLSFVGYYDSGRRESERARERKKEKRHKRERRARRKRLHRKNTTHTVAAGRQQVQWAGVCPGRPALPRPCPALFVTIDRQTDRHREKKRKWERRAKRKRLHCKKTTQTVAAGRQQVQWAGVCLGRPALFVTTDKQTNTTVAFIYRMYFYSAKNLKLCQILIFKAKKSSFRKDH